MNNLGERSIVASKSSMPVVVAERTATCDGRRLSAVAASTAHASAMKSWSDCLFDKRQRINRSSHSPSHAQHTWKPKVRWLASTPTVRRYGTTNIRMRNQKSKSKCIGLLYCEQFYRKCTALTGFAQL